MLDWRHFARRYQVGLKWMTLCFAVIIVILGLSSLIIGCIINSHYGDYINHVANKYIALSTFFVLAGVLVTIVGIAGLIACIRQGAALVVLFGTFLFVLFIVEVIAGGIAFSEREQVNDNVSKVMNQSLLNYNKNSKDKKFLNWVQNEFSCCGLQGQSDWIMSGQEYPSSCCKRERSNPYCIKIKDNIQKKGCEKVFQHFMRETIAIIGTIAMITAALEVFGIPLTFLYQDAIKLGVYEAL